MTCALTMSMVYIPGDDGSIFARFCFAFLSFLSSTLGDLYNSRCKRLAGVKDTGSLMGAFGGVWDRMDSVMGNSIIVYLYTKR